MPASHPLSNRTLSGFVAASAIRQGCAFFPGQADLRGSEGHAPIRAGAGLGVPAQQREAGDGFQRRPARPERERISPLPDRALVEGNELEDLLDKCGVPAFRVADPRLCVRTAFSFECPPGLLDAPDYPSWPP